MNEQNQYGSRNWSEKPMQPDVSRYVNSGERKYSRFRPEQNHRIPVA